MSNSIITYPATDDEWIEAAGLNPKEHPQSISLSEDINVHVSFQKLPILSDIYTFLKDNNWMEVRKTYTLEERFKLYGLEILNKEEQCNIFSDHSTRTIYLSNGIVLQEVYNRKKSDMLLTQEDRDSGNVFVEAYSVTRIDKKKKK